MSHKTGKIQILAVDHRRIYARYHRAKDPAREGRFMVFRRNDEAYWLDDLVPVDPDRRRERHRKEHWTPPTGRDPGRPPRLRDPRR